MKPNVKSTAIHSLFIRLTSLIVVGVLLGACSSNSKDHIIIMGAASTRVINEDLQATVAPELSLEFNNAGSATLVSQLEEGAPADIFISADKEAMDKAVAAEVVADPKAVATNSMVLIVPADNPAKIMSFTQLGSAADATIIICDSQVPCGRVTQKLEQANNIKIPADSLEQSVSDVAGKVAAGEADAGVVYATDAAALSDKVTVLEIPHAQHHRNTLMAAVVTNSQYSTEATAIIDTLTGSDFAAIWQKHGFAPVVS